MRSASISAVLPALASSEAWPSLTRWTKPCDSLLFGAGLAVDEAEQPLAGGAEEVVAAVVGRLVERRHVGRALEHRGQRLAGVGRDVDDRLAGVEALDEQQVDPRLRVLAGRRRAGDVDAEHAVAGVRVVDDVERAVAGRDDRRAVDGLRAGDPDERAVARPGDRARLELRQREAVRARLGDPGRAEVRRALEVRRPPARTCSRPGVGESSVTVWTQSGQPMPMLPSLGA